MFTFVELGSTTPARLAVHSRAVASPSSPAPGTHSTPGLSPRNLSPGVLVFAVPELAARVFILEREVNPAQYLYTPVKCSWA